METFNIREAKKHSSKLAEGAASGEEIDIAKAGKPMAKLVPIEAKVSDNRQPCKLGLFAGKYTIPDDFDAPLPDEVLALFYEGALFPDESDKP
jgi:antitoxin (DNA-binding transcriptional repressor) of toxin-antitoxin stability system